MSCPYSTARSSWSVRRKVISVITGTTATGYESAVVSTEDTSLDGVCSRTEGGGLVTLSWQEPVNGSGFTDRWTVSGPAASIDNSTSVTKQLQTYRNGRLMSESTRVNGSAILGQEKSYAYNDRGLLETITAQRPGGSPLVTSYLYQTDGRIQSVTSPNPNPDDPASHTQVESYQYNDGDRETVTTYPDNHSTTQEFSPAGDLVKVSGTRTYPVEYTYDEKGRRRTMKTWQDSAEKTGAAITEWQYDALTGQVTNKIYQGAATSLRYEYYPSGRLKSRAWERGRKTTYVYSSTGNPWKVFYSADTETDNNITNGTPSLIYTYNQRGLLHTVTDNRNESSVVHTLEYDSEGRLQRESTPDSPSVGRLYNAVSQLEHLRILGADNPENILVDTQYGYTNAMRLVQISLGSLNNAVYGYNPEQPGQVNALTILNGSLELLSRSSEFDQGARLSHVHNTKGTQVVYASYEYSNNIVNQRTAMAVHGDGQVDASIWRYTYDDHGQVTDGSRFWLETGVSTALLPSVAGQQFHYVFDDIGNRQHVNTGGDAAGQNSRTSTYTVNLLNQYEQRTAPGFEQVLGEAETGAFVSVGSSLNPIGIVETERRGKYFRGEVSLDNSTSPQAGELTVVGVVQDANGKDVVSQYARPFYVPASPEVFHYDADGNLTGDGRWTYTWDDENRLIGMVANANVPVAAKAKVGFAYDYMGRRVMKTNYNYNAGSGQYDSPVVTKYLYDGWNLVAELDASNNLLRSYVWGLDLSGTLQGAGGVGGAVSMTVHQGTHTGTYFYYYDGNGNVMGLVNATDGSVSARYEYGPFGETLRATGPLAHENPFRWSTKYTDDETGLVYYGYRYYNPSTGRWLSRDPMGEKGGVNVFNFVGNDPQSKSDRIGLSPFFWYRKSPSTSFGKLSDDKRQEWFEKFKKEYGKLINKYARQYCVPKALLAAVIANEEIDYDKAEKIGEHLGHGKSLGPAQITIRTAIKYNLIPEVSSDDYPDITLQAHDGQITVSGDHYYHQALRGQLNDADTNIKAAARLMSEYLIRMCRDAKSGQMSQGFLIRVAAGCKTVDFCCQKDCSKVVDGKVPACLISAMAAAWNNDIGITRVRNPYVESRQAVDHADQAGQLEGVFDSGF